MTLRTLCLSLFINLSFPNPLWAITPPPDDVANRLLYNSYINGHHSGSKEKFTEALRYGANPNKVYIKNPLYENELTIVSDSIARGEEDFFAIMVQHGVSLNELDPNHRLPSSYLMDWPNFSKLERENALSYASLLSRRKKITHIIGYLRCSATEFPQRMENSDLSFIDGITKLIHSVPPVLIYFKERETDRMILKNFESDVKDISLDLFYCLNRKMGRDQKIISTFYKGFLDSLLNLRIKPERSMNEKEIYYLLSDFFEKTIDNLGRGFFTHESIHPLVRKWATVEDGQVASRTYGLNSVGYHSIHAWTLLVRRNEFDINRPFLQESEPYLLTYLVQTQNSGKINELLEINKEGGIDLRDEYLALAEKIYLENPDSKKAEYIYWKLRRYFDRR